MMMVIVHVNCNDGDGDDGCFRSMDYGKGVYCCVYNLLIPSQVLEVWL